MKEPASTTDLLREYQETLPEFSGMHLTSVHQRGRWGNTPLHIASHRGDPHEVRLLLAAGADPNASGENGSRPLSDALTTWIIPPAPKHPEQVLEVIHLLLKAGASVDLPDEDGKTAIELARLFKCEDAFLKVVQEALARP